MSCRTLLLPEKCSSEKATKNVKRGKGQQIPAKIRTCTKNKSLLKTSKVVPMLGEINSGDVYVATLAQSSASCMPTDPVYVVRPGGYGLLAAHAAEGLDSTYNSPYRIGRVVKK